MRIKLKFRVAKPKYRLADLMAEMPDGFPRVEGWDELPPVGREDAVMMRPKKRYTTAELNAQCDLKAPMPEDLVA